MRCGGSTSRYSPWKTNLPFGPWPPRNLHLPPTRTSISSTSAPPPHHSEMSDGSVNAFQTMSRGASNRRSKRISRSLGVVIVMPRGCWSTVIRVALSLVEQLCHPVQPLLDGVAVIVDPLFEILERLATELALADTANLARIDEACLFEQLDMLLHPGEGDTERLRQPAGGWHSRGSTPPWL